MKYTASVVCLRHTRDQIAREESCRMWRHRETAGWASMKAHRQQQIRYQGSWKSQIWRYSVEDLCCAFLNLILFVKDLCKIYFHLWSSYVQRHAIFNLAFSYEYVIITVLFWQPINMSLPDPNSDSQQSKRGAALARHFKSAVFQINLHVGSQQASGYDIHRQTV